MSLVLFRNVALFHLERTKFCCSSDSFVCSSSTRRITFARVANIARKPTAAASRERLGRFCTRVGWCTQDRPSLNGRKYVCRSIGSGVGRLAWTCTREILAANLFTFVLALRSVARLSYLPLSWFLKILRNVASVSERKGERLDERNLLIISSSCLTFHSRFWESFTTGSSFALATVLKEFHDDSSRN